MPEFTFNEDERVVHVETPAQSRGKVKSRRWIGSHEIVVVQWDEGYHEHVEAPLLRREAEVVRD